MEISVFGLGVGGGHAKKVFTSWRICLSCGIRNYIVMRRGGRVVEGARLESGYTSKRVS